MKKRFLVLPVLAVALSLAGGGTASASTNAPVHWNGSCYGNRVVGGTGSFAGWCDGNGPQTYQAYVNCTNGYRYYGPQHWFGDRRGSTAQCPSGVHSTSGGFAFPLGT